MKRITFTVALALTPAVLSAQTQARAQSQTRADAEVQSRPANASASATADAEIAIARERGLPERPMRRRAAEGRAKGASEPQLALALRSLRANLETAHETMVQAGRPHPTEEETERGGYVIENGYTSAQLEAVVESAPAERSLVVAFDVLTRLRERGVSSARAVAQVTSKLASRANDASLTALVSANSSTSVGVGRGGATAGTATSGNAAVGAAAGGTKAAAGATGTVTGTVKGVIKP